MQGGGRDHLSMSPVIRLSNPPSARPSTMDEMILLPIQRSTHNLTMSAMIGDVMFSSSQWFEGVDLYELEETYGVEAMERIYFHIAMFDLNKLFCLKPKRLGIGYYERYRTPEFDHLLQTIFFNCFSQWRYENDEPDYRGPTIDGEPVAHTTPSAVTSASPPGDGQEVLALIGGGKDSLVSMLLFEELGVKFDTLGYSNNVYGTAEFQHLLIEKLAKTHGLHHRKIWQSDQLLDSPVVQLLGDTLSVKTVHSAETPQCIFSTLLHVLKYGYRYVNLSHEASADAPNLIWEKTGLPINHQWGKSAECEDLVYPYVKKYLVTNCDFFSNLKSIHDAIIFHTLSEDMESFALAHSCNVVKPWCKRCAKCAYVWLGYMAFLPRAAVDDIFKENLMEAAENQLFFRQMLGLEDQTPFECVGQVDEARLTFELCYNKGVRGRAMDVYVNEVRDGFNPDVTALRLTGVDETYETVPRFIKNELITLLKRKQDDTRKYIKLTLAGSKVSDGGK